MADLKTYYKYTDKVGIVEEIDDAFKLTASVGSEVKNNRLSITMKNVAKNVQSDGTIRHRWVTEQGDIRFNAGKPSKFGVISEETIDVYAYYETEDPSVTVINVDNLLFNGIITKTKMKYSGGENSVEVECQDRTAVLLDRLTTPQPFSDTAPNIIQSIIRSASENNDINVDGFTTTGTTVAGSGFLIDARKFSDGVKQSGTTTSTATRKLIDTSATFTTNSVSVGDWVRNSTDEEYAYVVSVDSQTQLTLTKDLFPDTGDTYQVSDGFIQDTRPDDSAFPSLKFSQLDKPLNESISTLSQIEYTNNSTEADPNSGTLVVKRGMRWFIDRQNRFHWYVPSNNADHYMEVGVSSAISPDGDGHLIKGVDLNNESRDKINFIIFKAGEDMDGVQIKSFSRAAYSGTPQEKDALRNWLHIARNMKHEDAVAGNIVKNQFDDYNYPSGYPVTPDWDSQARSVSTDNDYNTNFKEEAVKRGKDRCRKIFQGMANPRWGGSITLRGEVVNPGDLIDFTSKVHGLRNIKMRVSNVSHSINSQGWLTTLTVLEDELEQEVGL